MWNGKNKAVTFSFDDGISQDKRLIGLLDKYGLKGTFNLNSGMFGSRDSLIRNGMEVRHDEIDEKEIYETYKNHEVAVHGLKHLNFRQIEDDGVLIDQIERDRKALEKIMKVPVVGCAYPYGAFNDHVVEIMRKSTGVKYSRTTVSTHNFDLQKDLLRFDPTVYFIEDCLFDIAQKFLQTQTDKPQLLYVWGHSFELDANFISWEKFESFCELVSGKKDVYYGTNAQVLL